MGNEISTARGVAVVSFVTNFAAQTYGMVSKPNMKDVAEANHYAFSPNPYFIAAFFSGQVVLQLIWIRKLFSKGADGYEAIGAAKGPSDPNIDEERHAWKVARNYSYVYALGNMCIAGWLGFWLNGQFGRSHILVTINTVAQLAAVAALPPLRTTSPSILRWTHLVAKTFAGIGVLDFFDNGGVAFRVQAPPSRLLQAATYVFFPVAAAGSTPLFGSVLLYDIVGMAVGQMGVAGAGEWPARLGWTALATGVIVGLKAIPVLRDYFN